MSGNLPDIITGPYADTTALIKQSVNLYGLTVINTQFFQCTNTVPGQPACCLYEKSGPFKLDNTIVSDCSADKYTFAQVTSATTMKAMRSQFSKCKSKSGYETFYLKTSTNLLKASAISASNCGDENNVKSSMIMTFVTDFRSTIKGINTTDCKVAKSGCCIDATTYRDKSVVKYSKMTRNSGLAAIYHGGSFDYHCVIFQTIEATGVFGEAQSMSDFLNFSSCTFWKCQVKGGQFESTSLVDTFSNCYFDVSIDRVLNAEERSNIFNIQHFNSAHACLGTQKHRPRHIKAMKCVLANILIS